MRLNGIQEVIGSIPTVSTKKKPEKPLIHWFLGLFCFSQNSDKFG